MEPVTLDALDRRLVHALQIDGRASFGRIAEVLGVSDRTLARRYRRLRAAGLVRVVGVPAAHTLTQAQWLVRLRCLPEVATRIADVLAARSDTSWVAIGSGGAEITCLTRSADELVLATMPRSPRIGEVTAQRLLRAVAGVGGWPRRLAALTADEVAALAASTADAGADRALPRPTAGRSSCWPGTDRGLRGAGRGHRLVGDRGGPPDRRAAQARRAAVRGRCRATALRRPH